MTDTELTREEANALADDLGWQLYQAEDRLAFIREQADAAKAPIDPAELIRWTKRAACMRAEPADGPGVESILRMLRQARPTDLAAAFRQLGWTRDAELTEEALRARLEQAMRDTCRIHDLHPDGCPACERRMTAVLAAVQPLIDDLAIADEHIARGNEATDKAYAQLRSARAGLIARQRRYLQQHPETGTLELIEAAEKEWTP